MYQFGFLVLCVLLLILNNLNKIVKCESEKSTQRGEHDRGGWDGKPTFHFILYAFNAKEFIFINFSHPTSRSRDFVYFLHFNFQPTLQIPYKNVKKFNIQHFFGRNQIWIFIFKHCAFIIIIYILLFLWCTIDACKIPKPIMSHWLQHYKTIYVLIFRLEHCPFTVRMITW